jgi:lantibiotic transport system ATP-binding protein
MYCLETSDLSLETFDLAHRFARQDVLRGIDMQVPAGSIYGFLGPNGAGKTTTLRLILGLLRRQRGEIRIFGKRFDDDRMAILRSVGSMIESPSLYDHLSAAENLRLLQLIHRCPENRIDEVLELVGLGGTASHLLSEIERVATHVGILGKGTLLFQGPMDELRRRRQEVLSVRVSTSDNAEAARAIAEDGIAARLADGEVVLPALTAERIAAINRRLTARNLDVYEIRAVRNDLETIFLDLVQE